MSQPSEKDARALVENALAVLEATPRGDARALARSAELAQRALAAARALHAELDAQLEAVTAPGFDAARELLRLRGELERERAQGEARERELGRLREELEIEQRVHQEERRRLAELEGRVKSFDGLLLKEDELFERYMDRALDEDERKGRGRR